MPLALALRGTLDKDALRRAIETVILRHEVLRTSFQEEDGTPFQVIGPAVPGTCFARWDTDLQGPDAEARLSGILQEEGSRPFDLATGPLLRFGLYQLGPEHHVLQAVFHHSVSDGWSLGVLNSEVSTLYEAFLDGRSSPLPELQVQYADYAAWQRDWLQGEVLEEQISYWREKLNGLTPLELPTDRPRPPTQSFRGQVEYLSLSRELTEDLRAFNRREGTTMFMTLMAAFQLLLSRYSGQTDIAVGTPIAGRNRSELEGLMGMFVNTLVVRTDLSGTLSFRELLRRVREGALEAQTYQDLPFEKLVDELRPRRDLSRNPLFQVMFAHQTTEEVELDLPGLSIEKAETSRETIMFDLSVSVWDLPEPEEGMLVSLAFARDLFDVETIERMGRHFENLLQAALADPDAPVDDLPLMDEEEIHALVVEKNASDLVVPEGAGIHHLFEAWVDRDPHRIAVAAEDGSLTYGELETRANRLAHYLMELGVGREVLVGVTLPRTTDMVVAVMGILKAGGAYLPLDPDLPPGRLEYMASDGGIEILVTLESLREVFPGFQGVRVCLDRDRERMDATSHARPQTDFDPEQLAYVIYTSGSTGRPKGAELCHRNVVSYFLSVRNAPGFSENDKMLAVTRLSFDISVREILGCLSAGAQIVLAPADTVSDGEKLHRLIDDAGVTVLGSTPATWRMLFDTGWEGNKNLAAWTGAESLPLDLAREMVAKCREAWQVYGPTETTVGATRWPIPENPDQIRIGEPVENARAYVLDARMQPVPIGVPGELHIGGLGVGRGYRNRPELTAERFVPDPFNDAPGARMYRTGDRARFRNDGYLEFLGRLDEQVKIRGFRIELGEIASVLSGHESVREAVVTIHGEGTDKRLLAYLVPNQGENLSISRIREFLREFLPDYMIPAHFEILEKFPRTPSGKVDRKALATPDLGVRRLENRLVEPRNETEEGLASIWQELLQIDRVGIEDDFFELGGHSLLATQLVSRIRSRFGVEFPLRRVFTAPTVQEMALDILEAQMQALDPEQVAEMLATLEEGRS
jgi:amino acid adenylation domain-containing protein